MLDHMSYGRLDVGVGRGVSPYELKYHKVEHDQSREIFIDAFKCVSAGLVTDTLSYKGEHYVYEDVPIAMRPLQQPHPPFWYGSSNEIGSVWAGEQGLHFVTLGPMATAKANIAAFKKALAKRGGPAQPKAEFSGGAVDWRATASSSLPTPTRKPSLRQTGNGSASRPSQLAARQARLKPA